MNARQKAKKYKKKINTLQSDNDLMRRIIADTPAMQELYDVYNKPKCVTHTTMQFQEYRSKRFLPPDKPDDAGFILLFKHRLAEELFECIKENITYEINTKCEEAPTIAASIFVGRK